MGLMQRFKREIRSSNGRIFAFEMRHGFGASLGGLFERVARGKVHDSEVREIYGVADDEADPLHVRLQAGPQLSPSSKPGKFTALVSMHGVALYDLEYQPYCFSTLLLSQIMDQLANDPMVDQIVLDINTPGGHVTGTQEAADAVWAARKKKPVIGIVNPLCASAGYWIASQCTKIIAVPSADIGSIGVFMTHYDCSAMLANEGIKPTFIYAGDHKVEGNSMEPLGEDARAWFQSEVDQTYTDFLAAVARGRGITSDQVLEKFGKGRCFGAPMAKRAGMVDEISSIKIALQGCGLSMAMPEEGGRRRRGEADEPKQGAQTLVPDEFEIAAMTTAHGDNGDAKSFTIRQDIDASGAKKFYVLEPWPAKLNIATDFARSAEAPMGRVGCSLTIAAENGAAVYTIIGSDQSGHYCVAVLEPGSAFSEAPPPPSAVDTTNDEATDQVDEPAADEVNRAAAESYRQRIAILSA